MASAQRGFGLANRSVAAAPIKLSTANDVTRLLKEGLQLAVSLRKHRTPVPEIAVYVSFAAIAEMLQRNKTNRPIVTSAAAEYLIEMQHGDWIDFGGQSLEFNEVGAMTNGQNRAVAAYMYLEENPTKMIGFNLKIGVCAQDALKSTDRGRSRTPADHLELIGIHANAPALRLALFATKGHEVRTNGSNLTQIYKLLQTGHDTVMTQIAKHDDSGLYIRRRAPVLSALIRASYHVKSTELNRFIELLCAAPGAIDTTEEHEKAVFRLREKLITAELKSGGFHQRRTAYYMLATAIKRFVNRELVRNARSALTDLFPLPTVAEKFMLDMFEANATAKTATSRKRIKDLSPNFSR